LIRPTVWPQYTNVTDRTDRQRTDSIGRTVLQMVAQWQPKHFLHYVLFAQTWTLQYCRLLCLY